MYEYPKEKATLGFILEDLGSKITDRPFLQFEDEAPVTYGEVNEIANRVGNSLYNLGLRRGDNISIFSPNCIEYIYTWFGASKIGVAEASVNTAYKADYLSYTINDSESKILVVHESLLEPVKSIQDTLKRIEKVVVIPKDKEGKLIPTGLKFEAVPFSDLYKGSPEYPEVAKEVRYTDIGSLIYTSGTTGYSKGVIMSNYYMYIYSVDSALNLGLKEDDILLTCLPFFHGNPKVMCIYPALLLGAKVVMEERFSATRFWDWIRKYGITATNLIGVMMPFLMNQSKRDDDSDNPLERVLILPNPPRMTEAFLKRFGVKQYFAGFGQTEVGVLSAKACNEDAPSDSAGKVCKKRYDVRVFDENDNELPPGKVGEFVLRPHEAYTILSGYYNKPEKTLECLRNVWFHTGDGGYITEDGYLYFTDRVKDYIRRRGENISSYEIERTIGSHPSVEELAVIGVKSEYGGLEEEVKVCIVLKEGKALKPEELMVWCEERMPYYLIPRYVEFMDKLPKTPTEKVEKYKLRKFGVTEGTWDREKAGYKIKK